MSMLGAWHGNPPTTERNAVLVEHHGPSTDSSDPDLQLAIQANPPAYEALRFKDALYVEYTTGEHEYYDLTNDPNELANVYTTLSRAQKRRIHNALLSAKHCEGRSCQHKLHH